MLPINCCQCKLFNESLIYQFPGTLPLNAKTMQANDISGVFFGVNPALGVLDVSIIVIFN